MGTLHPPKTVTFSAKIFQQELQEMETRYYFDAVIANKKMVPDRFCFFAESTLQNISEDATTGVALLDSHNDFRLGLGYSDKGVFETDTVRTRLYIVRGSDLGAGYSYQNTDVYIKMIEEAAVRDVSMCLFGGRSICSICNSNIWNYSECRHFPGNEYEVDEDKENKLCTYTIHDANLSEISLVVDGAVPGAMIDKTYALLDAGEITLDTVKSQFSNFEYRPSKEVLTVNQPTPNPTPEPAQHDCIQTLAKIQAEHPDLVLPTEPNAALTLLSQTLAKAKTDMTAQQQELETTKAASEDGVAYREACIETAEKNYVRCYGNNMPDIYTQLFANPKTKTEDIVGWAETWDAEFKKNVPHAGKTRTRDLGEGFGSSVVLPRAYQ